MKKRPGLAHFKKKNYSQIKAIGGEWWCKNKYLKNLQNITQRILKRTIVD